MSATTKLSELYCKISRPSFAPGENKFAVLLSPLQGDDADHSNTHRILETFLGEQGFRAIPICEPLKFDFSKPLDIAKTEAIRRAKSLIKNYRADILLFGEVLEKQKTIKIWAINEHGGCDWKPKPTLIEEGSAGNGFNYEISSKLIAVTLEGISGACLEHTLDLADFTRRIDQLGTFIDHLPGDFPETDFIDISVSYSNAARILNQHDHLSKWLENARRIDAHLLSRLEHISDIASLLSGSLNRIRLEASGT